MIKSVLLCALACLAAVSEAGPFSKVGFQEKIVGGQEATPHAYPWQISLQYRDLLTYYHTCGATIVDEYHIVCAAHCVDGRQASHFRVIAGAHNIGALSMEGNHQKRSVTKFWKHESYDHNTITNDISVLRLDKPLEFNEYVQPIKMAELGSDPASDVVCINSGWGSTSHTNFPSMPNKLQYVELPIIERSKCQSYYSGINGVDDGMVCGGQEEGGISPCSGDSGGPLVCPDENGEYYLAGVVSWGMIPCGQPRYPGVFTNVGFYRDWVDEHIAL